METSFLERTGYYSYFVGQNIIYIFVTMYLSVYFATVLGIPAATIGLILLGARIWDAVNDPLLSIMVEKSRFKKGKFKPWINGVAVFMPLATILIFSNGGFLIESPMWVRVTYATGTYVLWGMLYTISDAPAFALATVMTSCPGERNTIISMGKLFAFFGILIAMITAPLLIDKTGNNWFLISVILSAAAFFFIIQVVLTRERVESTQKSPTLKVILSTIFRNKYTVTFVIVFVISMGFNFGITIMPFVAKDIFGDPGITAVLMMATIVPSLIIVPFIPRLIERYGKLILYKFSSMVIVVISLVTYFAGYSNFTLFVGLSSLKGMVSGFLLVLPALFFADCIEYDYIKTGRRFEAATFALQTFSNKAIGAVAGAGAMGLLALFGYVEATGKETVVQNQQVVSGMWLIYNIGPAFGALLSLIIFWIFYDLTELKLKELARCTT